MLINLVSASNASNPDLLWGYVSAYAPGVSRATHPKMDDLVGYAMAYYRDFVAPHKSFRLPNEAERAALRDLKDALGNLADDAAPEDIQTAIFAVGKAHEYDPLRAWFGTIYECLLGQSEGPRMGSFVKLYGITPMTALIDEALERGQ